VSVATSEPVVLHHGREGGVAGHHEARPSASTACWAAMPFSASAVPVAGLSQLRGEFANELCTHARLGQSEKCWHGLPTVSRCISEPSAGSRKPSVRRPGWPTISSLGYGERTERGSTEVRRSLGPLLSRFFKPSADGLEGNEGRVVIRTYTNPRCDELLRTPASGCDENGLETLGPAILGQCRNFVAKFGEPEIALVQVCLLDGRQGGLREYCPGVFFGQDESAISVCPTYRCSAASARASPRSGRPAAIDSCNT